MPLLEETGHMPIEKYAHAPGDPRALPAHREAVRPLRRRPVPHRRSPSSSGTTTRTAGSSAPTGATSSPRSSSAMGTGPAPRARSSRASPASSRSRATRSTPAGGTTTTPAATRPARRWTGLADKRVAIIGTGATSVQCVPHLARACGELYVFQRTPSSVDVRDNRPTDPEWFAEIATPGLAAALARELHRQPDRRPRRRGPRAGRLDRPRPPDARPRSWRSRPRSSPPRG